MMKRISSLLLALVLMLCASASGALAEESAETIDYVAQLHLNMASASAKTTATVKTYVDGDTVHFYVPESVCADGVMKTRFLALNTPETTGKIEEYGQKASSFTHDKLANAVSIILESDSDSWELDSTGGRMLVWVWYQPEEGAEYRNLNLELLQNGLAKAYSTANNQYGSICSNALEQARQQKLNLYSGEPDPDFYYGDAIELTIKELRCHPEAYLNKKVAFNGIVTVNHSNSVYVEDLDEETGLVFGISVYYGYGLSGKGLTILTPGNEVRIVGTVQYYEAGDQYQVSDLTYRMMKPKDPGNIQMLSEGHTPAYTLTTLETLLNDTVTILDAEDGTALTFPYWEIAQATSIEVQDLQVQSVQTLTSSDSSESTGLILTCVDTDGKTILVRTELMENADQLIGKTLSSVRGYVEKWDGVPEIRSYTVDAVVVAD